MYVLSYQASVSLSNPAYQSISECLFLYQLLKLFNNKWDKWLYCVLYREGSK